HTMAAKYAGFDKITFGGGAVHEVWNLPHYGALDFLYNTSGHPGAMANYISACCLATILTGVNPTGNTARAIKMSDWQTETFDDLPYGSAADRAFYAANSNRVINGHLILTDDEAATLQQAAMNWHSAWDGILHSNLADNALFAFTTAEVARIHAQMTNYAAYNLSQAAIDKLTAQYAEAEAGQLTDAEIEAARSDSRDFIATVNNYANDFLTPAQVSQLRSDYIKYWDARNSKFRDDVFFESLCYLTILEKGTNAVEVTRMQEETSVHLNIVSLAGMRLLFERITDAQRQMILSNYKWQGARSRYCPLFYQAQMNATGDWQRLIAVWERYIDVWNDPNLMDALKGTEEGIPPRSTNCFLQSVWLDSDRRFSNMAEQVALSPVSPLTVPENGTNTFSLKLTGPPAAGVMITVSVSRISATNCDIVVTGGAPCHFTSANWNAYQPVTLAAQDDANYTAGSAVFRCTAPGGVMMDVNVTEIDDDNLAPNAPVNAAPADGVTNQPLALTLQASAFSDANPGDTHAASQWQVGLTDSFSSIVWDSGTDSVNLTSVTIPALAGGKRYYWRVRYRDAGGLFSGYSAATWFETDPRLNNLPDAVPDNYMMAKGAVLDVPAPGVLANDTDADGDPLTAVKVADPAHGALALNADGSFTYTPETNWQGADSFTYRASDGKTNSGSVSCMITVGGVGAILLEDSFDDGGISGGADPNDVQWYNSDSEDFNVTYDNGALYLTNFGNNNGIACHGGANFIAPARLNAQGDKIMASLKLTTANVRNAVDSGPFGFGMFNGPVLTGTFKAVPVTGYYFFVSSRTVPNNTNSMFYEEGVGPIQGDPMGGTDCRPLGAASNFFIYGDYSTYTFELAVQRTALGVDLYFTDGVHTQVATDTSDACVDFNSIYLGIAPRVGVENDVWVDDIRVQSFVIPEPAVLPIAVFMLFARRHDVTTHRRHHP
ncbi:cadherin-like domain-containing protein, partial [bacterium]|nr:cadherin-like domain-containing protein [bacterium]